jgi:flavin reductase
LRVRPWAPVLGFALAPTAHPLAAPESYTIPFCAESLRTGGCRLNTYELRTCLGCFGTGVTVVTVQGPSEPRGLTVNAFTSVSLDPPLVLVSINKKARSHDLLRANPFAINVLASDQEHLALNFAGTHDPKLEIPWREGKAAPYLGGTVAHFQCEPHEAYDGGDHTLFIGRIVHFRYNDGDALGYFRSRFTRLAEPRVAASPGTQDPFELPYDAYE